MNETGSQLHFHSIEFFGIYSTPNSIPTLEDEVGYVALSEGFGSANAGDTSSDDDNLVGFPIHEFSSLNNKKVNNKTAL